MRFRDRVALTIPPLLIRLGLATVFIWAGSSKLFFDEQFSPEDAAILANLGMIGAPSKPAAQTTESKEAAPEPEVKPAQPESKPEPKSDSDSESTLTNDQPAAENPENSEDSAPADNSVPDESAQSQGKNQPNGTYSAADFPKGAKAVRAKTIAVTLHRSAHPTEGPRLWPPELASPMLVRLFTWCAALTEFLGGVLVLIGFLTRISALGLSCTMLTAMLLTTIGPAMGSPDAFLGFLPPLRFGDSGGAWVQAWQPWLFQFVLLLGALALVTGGAGRLSIDALAFPARHSSTEPSNAD